MRKRFRYILLLVILIVVVGLMIRRSLRGPTIPTSSYLLLDIRDAYDEAAPQDILGRLLRRRERTLIDLLTTIREAQVDTRLRGMILRVGALDIGWAKTQDIRDALLEFKKSGKPLLALLEQEVSGSNKEYYLASAADRVYLSPGVTAPLNGLAAQFFFLGGVWEKLDIQMDVEKVREYKMTPSVIAARWSIQREQPLTRPTPSTASVPSPSPARGPSATPTATSTTGLLSPIQVARTR